MGTEVNHFEEFSEALNPPSLTTESTIRQFHVLTGFPQHMTHVYSHIHEGRIRDATASKFIQYTSSFSDNGMSTDQWKAVLSSLEKGSLAGKDVSATKQFLKGKPGMCAMLNLLCKIEGQRKVIEEKWTPLDVSKLYLTIYQPNYADLLASVMPGLRYDAQRAILDFKTNHPSINTAELIHVVKTISE